MKTNLLITILILTLSCIKDNVQDTQGHPEVNITKAEWIAEVIENGFGEVRLKIEGNTNGGLLTIDTYGDGLSGCAEIQLDNHGYFDAEILILFMPGSDTIPRKYSTYINVYEKSESPEVVFCRTGTGETIRQLIESEYLVFRKK
jgi:hypothetical protein